MRTQKTVGKPLSYTRKFAKTQAKCLDLKDPPIPKKIKSQTKADLETDNTNPTETLDFWNRFQQLRAITRHGFCRTLEACEDKRMMLQNSNLELFFTPPNKQPAYKEEKSIANSRS